MDGSGQARRRGPVFVGKTFPRVVGSCSSGILTPCSCAVRWVRQVRDWTPLLSHFWTFTVEHSGALGSKNPVESNWYSLVSPARILEWKNHLCGLNHGSNHDSEELLNCYTWRERIKVGVRKIHFYCASSTADGGSWEQETAVPDTSDLGQRPSALCCSRGGTVALLCLWQLGRTWPVAYSGCQIIPKRWHLVSVLGGTRLLFARTSLHLWELHRAAFLLQQIEGLPWLFFSWLCLLLVTVDILCGLVWHVWLKPFRAKWLIIRSFLLFPVIA